MNEFWTNREASNHYMSLSSKDKRSYLVEKFGLEQDEVDCYSDADACNMIDDCATGVDEERRFNDKILPNIAKQTDDSGLVLIDCSDGVCAVDPCDMMDHPHFRGCHDKALCRGNGGQINLKCDGEECQMYAIPKDHRSAVKFVLGCMPEAVEAERYTYGGINLDEDLDGNAETLRIVESILDDIKAGFKDKYFGKYFIKENLAKYAVPIVTSGTKRIRESELYTTTVDWEDESSTTEAEVIDNIYALGLDRDVTVSVVEMESKYGVPRVKFTGNKEEITSFLKANDALFTEGVVHTKKPLVEDDEFDPEDDNVSDFIHDLIIDEHEAIQGYDKALNSVDDTDLESIFDEIKTDEYNHIGSLETALDKVDSNDVKADIKHGEDEAEEADELQKESLVESDKKLDAVDMVKNGNPYMSDADAEGTIANEAEEPQSESLDSAHARIKNMLGESNNEATNGAEAIRKGYKAIINKSVKEDVEEQLTEATDLPDDLLKAYKGKVRRQGDRSDAEKSATARAGFGNIGDKYDKRSEYAFDKASAEEISKEDAKKIFADKKADKSNIHMLSGKGDLITYDEKGKPVHKVDANTSKYAWLKNNDYTFKNASGKDVPSTAYMPVNDVIDQSAKIYKVNLPRTDADTMKARDENPESRKYTTYRIDGRDPGFKHSLLDGNYDDRYVSAERGLANYWNKNPEVNLDAYKNGDDYNSLSALKQRVAKSNIDAAEYDNKAAEADKYAALANAARDAGLDAKDFEKAASRAQNYRDNAKYYRDMANEYANRIQRNKWQEDDYRANRRNFNSEREFLDKEYKLRDLISARNDAEWYKNNAASKLGDESPELKNAKAALADRQAEFDRAQAALRDAQAAHDKWLADDEPRRAKYQKEYDDRAAKYDAAQNDIKNFYHKTDEALDESSESSAIKGAEDIRKGYKSIINQITK